MAKVRGPLLSFGARGSVGRVLTFRESARRHVVSTVPLHPDARSAAQLAQRGRYYHAKTYWHTLTATEQAQLLTDARPDRITGYNLLLRQYLTDLLHLEAWWPLNDQPSGIADDYSLHETNLAYVGGTPAADFCANPLNAVDLNGSTEWITGSAPQIDFTTEDFTIVARIYLNNYTDHPMVLDNALYNNTGYRFFVSNTGSLRIETYHQNPGEFTYTANAKVPASAWHTVAASRQGATCWVYVDGIDETSSHGTHANPAALGADTYLGVNRDESNQALDGVISDVKVFSRLLTSAEHLLLHQRGCIPLA